MIRKSKSRDSLIKNLKNLQKLMKLLEKSTKNFKRSFKFMKSLESNSMPWLWKCEDQWEFSAELSQLSFKTIHVYF